MIMKTFVAKPREIEHKWYLVDADGQVLGRMATRVADILRGKDKPIYSRHLDAGDFVVVINAEKVRVTGRKDEQKVYHRKSTRVGGMKTIPYETMLERFPERVITQAVKGMIPKTKLGRAIIKKLKVYRGGEHPHEAQRPQKIEI